MVNDTIQPTILKAKFGSDIRKSQLRHSQDLNFNDLVLMIHRIFQIHTSNTLKLKYRDNGNIYLFDYIFSYLEDDWITLANDDDVLFALTHEPYLYIEVFSEEVNGQNELNAQQHTTESAPPSKEEVTNIFFLMKYFLEYSFFK